MISTSNNKQFLSSFARRIGKTLGRNAKKLIENELPSLSITPENAKDLLTCGRPIEFEIGFGDGTFLADIAGKNPETLFIGCEPYLNGVAKLLEKIKEDKLLNIRIYTDDARNLLLSLPDNCLDFIYVLFPDPWPKTKHKKRRIISDEFIELIKIKSKRNARLLFATDHQDYANSAHKLFKDTGLIKDESLDYFKGRVPEYWVRTKYQRKMEKDASYFFELSLSK